MKYRRLQNFIVARLDEDEKIIESLERICSHEGVTGGVILSAVGALKSGTLIFRRGCQGEFNEHLEIIGNGNISRAEGKVKVHLHIAGGNEKTVMTGHLVEGVVTVFCEILIQTLGFNLERKMDHSLLNQGVLNPYVLEP
ncbi:MAG: PPC domain-containing DNA-binding protein [Candidatus Hadarchaeum sp.]|uniref:PPC domain-containing DNA-binding protein n=1 Tax=Candidatus Hadarchaeum sp. TaxID=2883567 RepID=UPI003D0EF39B